MPETAWERTKKYSGTAYSKALKPSFDKVYSTVDKLGPPINRLSNKLGAEAFWPTSLDKESDKAARILRSFCKDGFFTKVEHDQPQKVTVNGEKVEGPVGKQRVLKKIPTRVIQEAKGLAIFTTMRTALGLSGAGGSGVLVARNRETGAWSPPSGIMLHTVGLGFLAGVDIYDCVVVINTYEALDAFTKVRCTLGGEFSVAAGPLGLGAGLESEVHTRQAPVWTYLKSRGFYAGVQVDGTVVIERGDENETFYGERIAVADILAGKARSPPEAQYRMLMKTIKAAQGDKVDENELPAPGTAPGDLQVETETTHFGIPDFEDPDPYGVKALQLEGFEIREAGTKSKPSADVFEFKPATTSPVYSNYRKSVELRGRTNSWRGSMYSVASVDKSTQTEQTDDEDCRSPIHNPRRRLSPPLSPARKETEHVQESTDEEGEEDDDQVSDLKSSIQETSHVQTAVPVVARARVVQVAKRIPPQLPPRNPNRTSQSNKDEGGADGFDTISLNGSERSDVTLEKGNSSIETDDGANKAPQLSTDGKTHVGMNAAPGWAGEDEFHSVPPSPATEHQRGIPGAF